MSGSSWSSPDARIAGYAGETVTLMPVTSSGNVIALPDGTISYVIFDHLILDGRTAGGAEGASVVYLGNSSHHIRFTGVEIINGDGNSKR